MRCDPAKGDKCSAYPHCDCRLDLLPIIFDETMTAKQIELHQLQTAPVPFKTQQQAEYEAAVSALTVAEENLREYEEKSMAARRDFVRARALMLQARTTVKIQRQYVKQALAACKYDGNIKEAVRTLIHVVANRRLLPEGAPSVRNKTAQVLCFMLGREPYVSELEDALSSLNEKDRG